MGIVGGAAKVRVQKSSRTASQNLPKCCIMADSAVACSGLNSSENSRARGLGNSMLKYALLSMPSDHIANSECDLR